MKEKIALEFGPCMADMTPNWFDKQWRLYYMRAEEDKVFALANEMGLRGESFFNNHCQIQIKSLKLLDLTKWYYEQGKKDINLQD